MMSYGLFLHHLIKFKDFSGVFLYLLFKKGEYFHFCRGYLGFIIKIFYCYFLKYIFSSFLLIQRSYIKNINA